MSEMTLEWPVGVYNNVHGLGVLHSSHLGIGKIALALCNICPLIGAGQHCLLSMQGPYTAVKKSRFEGFLGK